MTFTYNTNTSLPKCEWGKLHRDYVILCGDKMDVVIVKGNVLSGILDSIEFKEVDVA